ncbi:MAG: hypothetical protein ACJARS_002209 [bacterium]
MVDAVAAHVPGVWPDIGVLVIAVVGADEQTVGLFTGVHRHALTGKAVSVEIDIPSGGVDGVLVDTLVAVLVDTIADLGGTGVDSGVVRCAVPDSGHMSVRLYTGIEGAAGDAVAVCIGVRIPSGQVRDAVVYLVVAVIVDAVARLGGAREGARDAVVAVVSDSCVAIDQGASQEGESGVSIPITVSINVKGAWVCGALVHETVTVVVEGIAQLGGAGVAGRVVIGAVESARRIPVWQAARGHGGQRGIPPAIPIGVGVERPSVCGVFVDSAVAVVVGFVAPLGSAGKG